MVSEMKRNGEKVIGNQNFGYGDQMIALKQTNSYDEIAKDLDIKTGTLRQMFSRAKEKFIRCMGFFDE